jgi:hypothetical protein
VSKPDLRLDELEALTRDLQRDLATMRAALDEMKRTNPSG